MYLSEKLQFLNQLYFEDYVEPGLLENDDVELRPCANGSSIEGDVIKAVMDFIQKYEINEYEVIHEEYTNPTYFFRKP